MPAAIPLKLTRIGNSRGVRIPTDGIRRLGLDRSDLTAEVRSDGLLLKAKPAKLSWTDTAKAMSAGKEDWRDLENASADGLPTL